jgi:integrase
MVFLAAATGLRASELLGLKWQDVDFESPEISLNRGVVHQVVAEIKTAASQEPIPLDPELARELLVWRYLSPFSQRADWVFASPEMKGRQPYWPAATMISAGLSDPRTQIEIQVTARKRIP